MIKQILIFLSKQAGYILALCALTVGSIYLGIFFVSTDSQPQDAAVLTPMIAVPTAFVSGVLLCKLFNRKRKD